MKPKDLLVFLHIPKAAGQTIEFLLERVYGRPVIGHFKNSKIYKDNTLLMGKASPLENYWMVTPEVLNNFETNPESVLPKVLDLRVITGHVPFGIHERMKDRIQETRYFTILREPVSRVLSQYFYLRAKYPDAYRSISLSEYLRDNASIDNVQTRMLAATDGYLDEVPFGACSEEMLERAKHNLENYFALAGLTERFDETLLLLKQKLCWPDPHYLRVNVTQPQSERKKISEPDLEYIRQYNQLDLALYDFVTQKFNDAINTYGPSFSLRLGMFRLTNRLMNPILSLQTILHENYQRYMMGSRRERVLRKEIRKFLKGPRTLERLSQALYQGLTQNISYH
jgi:hypothetical protein